MKSQACTRVWIFEFITNQSGSDLIVELQSKKRFRLVLLKSFTWFTGLVPTFWLVWRFFDDRLGPNPIEEILHRLGDISLIFLLATLAVTPLRGVTGWNELIKIRRLLGLFGFFYLTMHFLTYAVLDQTLDFEFIIEDVMERPYISIGFTAWVLLIPLAITSTKGWIRRLGKRWKKLHRLAYVATIMGVIHFYWQVKADTYWPTLAAMLITVLMIYRLRNSRLRSRSQAGQPENH